MIVLLAAAGFAVLVGLYGTPFVGWVVFIAACLQVTTRPPGPSLSLGLFGYVLMLTQIPVNQGGHVVVVGSLIANTMLRRGLKKTAVNTAVHLVGWIAMAATYVVLLDVFDSVWPSVAAVVALFIAGLVFELVTTALLWRLAGMTWRHWSRTEGLMFSQTVAAVVAALAVTVQPALFLIGMAVLVVPPLRHLQREREACEAKHL